MNLYGIETASTDVNGVKKQYAKKSETAKSSLKDTKEDTTAAVYEKQESSSGNKVNYQPDRQTIERLKADAELRTSQLRDLVAKMFNKQGKAFQDADMYSLLSKGDFEVDSETRAKALEDISENGYYGIKETSNRLLSFAKALTGGDPQKADKMIDAVKKGFEEAAKVWGKELPEICRQTMDETLRQLEEWKTSVSSESK